MKDEMDMITDVRSLVNVVDVTSQISGKVYPSFRPSGRSGFKDYVVNAIGIDNDQVQIGFGNINIYVPTITKDGEQVADQVEFKRLVNLTKPLLDGAFRSSFSVKVESAGKIFLDEDGSYFANINYKYTSVQDDYKHV